MNNIPGAYTCFRPIMDEDRKIFEKALYGFVGVDRTLLAVATQAVNGTNYAFLCYSKVVGTPETERYNDLVIIHQPSTGAPHIMEIRKIVII